MSQSKIPLQKLVNFQNSSQQGSGKNKNKEESETLTIRSQTSQLRSARMNKLEESVNRISTQYDQIQPLIDMVQDIHSYGAEGRNIRDIKNTISNLEEKFSKMERENKLLK